MDGITPQELFAIIGDKECQIYLLRKRVEELVHEVNILRSEHQDFENKKDK